MVEDLADEVGIGDIPNDPQLSAAQRAERDIDFKLAERLRVGIVVLLLTLLVLLPFLVAYRVKRSSG